MIQELFGAVVELSYKGAWVAAALLLARHFLGAWMPARLRFLLWSLLGIRLLVPHLPTSPISVQKAPDLLAAPLPGLDSNWAGALSELAASSPPSQSSESFAAWVGSLAHWQVILPAGWLLVASFLAVRVFWALAQCDRQAAKARSVDDPYVLSIFEDCLARVFPGGLLQDQPVPLKQTEGLSGPVLCGLHRPSILISPDAGQQLKPDQLRDVLLHELAHVSRRDPIWQSLAFFIICLHWFNPILWLAFRAFRDDLEMACDAAVLRILSGDEDRKRYGHTLIDLGVRAPGPLAAASFAVDSRRQLKRRLEMIARFTSNGDFRPTPARYLAMAALLVGLAALTLTDLPLSAAGAEHQKWAALSPEEVADIFAEKLGSTSDESAVAVAQELQNIWQANQNESEEIKAALLAKSEEVAEAGQGELSGMLTKMVYVLAEHQGKEAPQLSASVARVKSTVQVMREAGTAMYAHFGAGEKSPDADAPTQVDWTDCSPISTAKLRKMADKQGWGPLPHLDGWGYELEYCVDENLLKGEPASGAHRFGVRSTGMDGQFAGVVYPIGAFDPAEPAHDLVWLDGYFATWPSRPEA